MVNHPNRSKQGKWRPIEGAPTDGTACVVNDPSGEYDWTAAYWAEDSVRGEVRRGWWDDGFWMSPQPTLYFPVPSPPLFSS